MESEHRFRRRVEFADTDAAGIMHFSNFFRFMEAAEHAFFRALGLPIHASSPDGMLGMARLGAECRYLAPLRFEDEVEVHVRVESVGEKTIRYGFSFRKVRADGEVEDTVVATGSMDVIRVRRGSGDDRLRAAALDEEIRRSITPAARDGERS